MPSFPAKTKILLILAKTFEKQKLHFPRSALFRMKTKVSLKFFGNSYRLAIFSDISKIVIIF